MVIDPSVATLSGMADRQSVAGRREHTSAGTASRTTSGRRHVGVIAALTLSLGILAACTTTPPTGPGTSVPVIPEPTTMVQAPTTAAPTSSTSTSTSTSTTTTESTTTSTTEAPTTTTTSTTTTEAPATTTTTTVAGTPVFDTFETTDTEYANVIQYWVNPSKFGLAFTANEDIEIHGAIWYRIKDVDGTTDEPVLHLSADMTEAPAVASKAASTHWAQRGWETITFDEPIRMSAGEQRVIWITTTDARDIARQGDYFVEPNNVSPGGLITAQYPSSRYNANGWEPGTENIPPTATSPTTSYWLFPLATAATD